MHAHDRSQDCTAAPPCDEEEGVEEPPGHVRSLPS